MYVIAKQKGQYISIPIPEGASWEFYKVRVGRKELRIVLRVKGRRYMIYTTRSLAEKYQYVQGKHLESLCDEIIAVTSEHIARGRQFIDFLGIAGAAECRHHYRWSKQGLTREIPVKENFGQNAAPKMKQVSYVCVELDDRVLFAQETPMDVDQEDLPY